MNAPIPGSRLVRAAAIVSVAGVLALASLAPTVAAPDERRLEEIPGYERYVKVRDTVRGVSGARISRLAWGEGGLAFTRGEERLRVDFATGTVAAVGEGEGEEGYEAQPRRRRGVARGSQRDRERSPDGKWEAVCRDWNVVLERTDDLGGAVAVTTTGTRKHRFGKASWVYGEELGQSTAMWWSPDGSKLVYYEFDERKVPDFHLVAGWEKRRTSTLVEGYPKPGEPNPIARLRIYDLASKKTIAAKVNLEEDHYVYGVRFAPEGQLLVNRTNRRQNVLEVLDVDLASGEARAVVREEQATWQRNSPTMRFLEDGNRFIWETEKTAWRHYELRRLDGGPRDGLITTLTRGEHHPCGSIAHVDEKNGQLWVTATSGPNPLNPRIHRVGLDGRGEVALTDGAFSSSLVGVSPDGRWFVARRETLDTPPVVALHRSSDGGELAILAETDTTAIAALGLAAPEMFSFTADDGVTEVYGWLYRPSDFDPGRRYPLVIDVYGGPHSSGVRNGWKAAYPQTELGFCVAKIGNRGTVGRGKAFETATYEKLGIVDIQDQVDGVRYLAKRPWIDGDRVGIFGHSYGGYMSALAILKFPDEFHVAVAGAPVTDWRHYDTIYTERFMWIPQENEKNYDAGSCNTYAKNLKGKLLICHGMVDDNVHPNNTWQLVDRLQRLDKRFDIQIFPRSAHGLGNPYGKLRWEYLWRNLVAGRGADGSGAEAPARNGRNAY